MNELIFDWILKHKNPELAVSFNYIPSDKDGPEMVKVTMRYEKKAIAGYNYAPPLNIFTYNTLTVSAFFDTEISSKELLAGLDELYNELLLKDTIIDASF